MAAAAWRTALSAAVLNGLGLGGRQAFGVFVSALNTPSGLGLPLLSLALALGQLALGAAQPALGRWADRVGAQRVIVGGAALFIVSTAMPAAWPHGELQSWIAEDEGSAPASRRRVRAAVTPSAGARDGTPRPDATAAMRAVRH